MFNEPDPATEPNHASAYQHWHHTRYLARLVLASFIFTFVAARVVVFLIMTHRMPDLYWYVGGTHLHHLNFGIFLLAVVGGYALFIRPTGIRSRVITVLYGVGLALTFDEFGMWLHLGGSYWQRTSWDACLLLVALLALVAYAPPLKTFEILHWWVLAAILIAAIVFAVIFIRSYNYVGKTLGTKLQQIESSAPK